MHLHARVRTQESALAPLASTLQIHLHSPSQLPLKPPFSTEFFVSSLAVGDPLFDPFEIYYLSLLAKNISSIRGICLVSWWILGSQNTVRCIPSRWLVSKFVLWNRNLGDSYMNIQYSHHFYFYLPLFPPLFLPIPFQIHGITFYNY